jgi:UDP-N-acetylglucosamine:LPS N-acetylglucosamine transferase
VVNALQSFWHLFTERPKVIISTGAGIAIPSLLFGKYLLKSKIIFIESAANVDHPSKTARFMYNHSDLFLVQWKPMLKTFPSATWVGVL